MLKGGNNIYINNITLNLLDKYYPFYEWLIDDDVIEYSKIKIIKVNSKTINDFLNNKILLLENPKDKIIVFSDLQNSIAIEFCNFESTYKSSLQLFDEKKVIDKLSCLKNETIKYQIISKENKSLYLRIDEDIKKVISTELETLIKNNNMDKIKYLYYEWFGKTSSNRNQMISNMYEKLNYDISAQEKKIYGIIKKSYRCV